MTDQKNNTGNWNTGHRNTGNWNTGHRNTGNWNTGHRNTGDGNIGNWNTGNWNTGNGNTGNGNTGHRNTGHRNTGDGNIGQWNISNRNHGYFNTETPKKVMVFDTEVDRSEWDECIKPNFIYFDLTVWVDESDMTQEEKDQNENYGNAGGYLKKKGYKEAFQESYKNASKEDRERIFNIPNFDADKFFEISGIDVRKDLEKEDKKNSLLEKAQELIDKAKELKKEAESM